MGYFRRRKTMRWVSGLSIAFVVICFFFRIPIINKVYELTNNTGQQVVRESPQTNENIDALLKNDQATEKTQVLNNNQPDFSQSDLKVNPRTGWQKFSKVDFLGRPQEANALLNVRMMPTQPRERLTVHTPGYQVIKDSQGNFIYNRSHLIGYQLTGENNNAQNLITGTRQLNASYRGNPNVSMETYENQIAKYLRRSANNYVRYEVKPIYSGGELVPRGVEMQAESVDSRQIRLHIFIPNTQQGYDINYWNGTVKQSKEAG